jgi:nicotinamide mononucleotide transporter
LALILAWFFDTYTDADKPYLDAFTTIFSFLATYLEAKKVLSAWVYWIVINGLTITLYYSKGLDYYSGLTVVYFVMSFVGYMRWKKELA